VLTVASGLMPSKARAQNDDDKKFLAMAAQSEQNEIALSKLAEQKTTNPAVKAFAEKMITEHTQMTASMKPFVDAWGLTPPTGPDAEPRVWHDFGIQPTSHHSIRTASLILGVHLLSINSQRFRVADL
jgi:Domain of unknown function (DUF4142)